MEEGRLDVDAIRVGFHETSQLLHGELSVKINDGSDRKQLNFGVFSSLKSGQLYTFHGGGATQQRKKKKGGGVLTKQA